MSNEIVQASERFLDLMERFNREEFLNLNEEMSFSEYLELIHDKPRTIRTAHQTVYDMIMEKGSEDFEKYDKKHIHYNFFDDVEFPIFGLEETLEELVKFIKGAAGGYGTEKRILLLHGPVGSSKSTICRLLKRGLERYSRTDDGAWYSYKWVDLPTGKDGISVTNEDDCPMHQDPLTLLPFSIRGDVVREIDAIHHDRSNDPMIYNLKCEGDLNPRCKKYMSELLKRYDGDLGKVINNHIRVVRKVHSEADRCGIATFQPKDEKNQDSTELTGDINYAKLPHFGSDSDPRAFNYDGEFCVGNRGLFECIEILKLETEFLYDFLGASQEQQIKPKKFSQIHIDCFLIGHTNNPEYVKLQSNEYMEALRDRTYKIDVPYLLEPSQELKVLEHDYGPGKVKQHIAPHTLEIAALWDCLSRYKDVEDLPLVDKAKLYDGKSLPGWNEKKVKEMRDRWRDEGMAFGVSARFTQDKISNCLSDRHDYINPFMVLNEIKDGLPAHLANDKEMLKQCSDKVDLAIKELNEILKNEVQKALVADENAIIRLCANYIDNIIAYNSDTKVKNPYTGEEEPPNERLMRSIEEKISIPENQSPDFRNMIARHIGELAVKDKKFQWDSNPELKKALEAKLFEDCKDTIKLSALNLSGTSVVDPDIQEKIDAIRQRLIDQYGYNEQSARDVLDHVGSIFARGELADDDE